MMALSSQFDSCHKPKTLGDILGAYLPDQAFSSLPVNKLSLDSRQITKGDIFVALKGGLYDGENFIAQAFDNGAAVALVDTGEAQKISQENNLLIIPIAQLNENLSQFAANFYNNPSEKMSVVGITGTNGKTSCAQFFAQATALLSGCCGVVGTTGYGVFQALSDKKNTKKSLTATGMTTPDPISVQKIIAQLVDDGMHHCAMEVSSHGLVQHRVAAVHIDTAVFTNLSHDHLDYHKTMDAYGQAKAQLFAMPSIKNAVVNVDDDYANTVLLNIAEHINVITYSVNKDVLCSTSNVHIAIDSVSVISQKLKKVILTVDAFGCRSTYSFLTTLVGWFNLSNLLAVISALYVEGFELENIIKVIQEVKSIEGRMESIESTAALQVIVDFAHTPDALEKALDALKSSQAGLLWCVFGCGGDRDKTKRVQMARIAEKLADRVVVTNDNPRGEDPESILDDIAQGFSGKFDRISDRAAAIEHAILHANKNDTVLVTGKGHENYQIIGTEKHYFSDQEQVKAALQKRVGGVND